MDRVFVENLRLDCRVGITDEERSRPQKVIVDLSLFLDLSRPAASGNVKDTIDYRQVRQKLSEFVSSGEFGLLETLADGVASLTLQGFPVDRVSVRVRKEKYAAEPSVGIEIHREREG